MTSKAALSVAFSLLLLALIAILVNSTGFVAGFEEASAITIRPNGTIEPPTAPIDHLGKTYVLTEDITYHYLDIECNGITVDGSGYTISTQGNIQSSRGIQVDANNVTLKNINIVSFGGHAIIVNGSFNFIENNFMIHNGGGIAVGGNYNTISRNNISLANMASEIFIYGNYNNITQNFMWGTYIDNQATDNIIVANTLYYIDLFGVNNIFYLNNLYDLDNNGFINIDANVQGNVFSFNGSGNYWSTYNGTDRNNDDIGDTPYKVVSNIEDAYPLMVPYDTSNQIIPRVEQPSKFLLETLVIAIMASVICAISILVICFKVNRQSQEKKYK